MNYSLHCIQFSQKEYEEINNNYNYIIYNEY